MTSGAPAGGERDFRAMRAALANLRAAAETLEAYPEMEIVRRTRLLGVLVEEAERLAASLTALELASRRPAEARPASIAVDELIALIEDRLAAAGLRVESAPLDPASRGAGIEIDAAELEGELEHVARGLEADFGVTIFRVAVGVVERFARFDLGWGVPEVGADAISGWVLDLLDGGPAGGEATGLRQLVQAHGGEVWYSLDRDGSDAHLRFLLPLATAPT